MEQGGKRKGFDELIFSFFGALNNIEKPYLKKLVKMFNIEEETLLRLSAVMEFEMTGIEQTAIVTFLEWGKSEK